MFSIKWRGQNYVEDEGESWRKEEVQAGVGVNPECNQTSLRRVSKKDGIKLVTHVKTEIMLGRELS